MTRFMLTSLIALSLIAPVHAGYAANAAKNQKTAVSSKFNPQDPSTISNEMDFRVALGNAGNLSLMGAKVGEDKASDDMVEDFAEFEIAEQQAISSVLKDLGTPAPKLSEKDQSVIDQLKSADKGAEFDRRFMEAQLETHQMLKDICEEYLDTKAEKDNMAETEAHHLATIALATINEHIAMSKKILAKMK